MLIIAVLYLIISVWIFALRNLSFVGSVSTTTDALSLSALATVSFENPNASSDLLSPQFWDTVLTTSGDTTAHILPNMFYGFLQSTSNWQDLAKSSMDNPPKWLSNGPLAYEREIVKNLSERAIGAGNAKAAAQVMDNFTAYAAGLSLAGVDQLSFNGASALRQYLETRNIFEAGLTTMPGQVYDLFSIAADSSYPAQYRAQILGEALAITAITMVTAGRDGFNPKFESMLTKLHLLDAWPKFKAYLMDIGTKSSPAEAYETTVILQQLANKFPSASVDDIAFRGQGRPPCPVAERQRLHPG